MLTEYCRVRKQVEGFRIRSEWFGLEIANYLCSAEYILIGSWLVSPSLPRWMDLTKQFGVFQFFQLFRRLSIFLRFLHVSYTQIVDWKASNAFILLCIVSR